MTSGCPLWWLHALTHRHIKRQKAASVWSCGFNWGLIQSVHDKYNETIQPAIADKRTFFLVNWEQLKQAVNTEHSYILSQFKLIIVNQTIKPFFTHISRRDVATSAFPHGGQIWKFICNRWTFLRKNKVYFSKCQLPLMCTHDSI